SWSVGNHDSVRVATRWNRGAYDPAFSKVVLAMQLSLKGTPCLYQGDELALTEAEIAFEDLQDPYGITFWPEFKGRDGCRTPIPWDGAQANAGFSDGKPWLPVPAEHAARAVAGQERDAASTLQFARRFMAWRKQSAHLRQGDIVFFDAPEPVLAFKRELPGQGAVFAAFNLGAQTVQFPWPEVARAADFGGHGMAGSNQAGGLSLPPYGAWFGTV
ncbi:MAG: alpha-glucosidase, partial [Burkholderiaceae bacterium]|nr:alpha-glucosidase [Burkholderiaceae bacterium]